MEDLSNELIYEIFEFLDYFHVYEAFFNLNSRFRNLLTNSNLPIKIDLSSLSKSDLKRYNEDIIETNMDRISTFRISDPFMYGFALSSLGKILEFGRIEILILNNIESECLEPLLKQLPSLPILSSLVIISSDHVPSKNSIYHQIFRLPALKYCKLSLLARTSTESLATSINEYSPIEHLIIKNSINPYELDDLLSYVPQLRRLSFHLQHTIWRTRTQVCPLVLNQLTHVDLQLESIKFDVLEQIIRELFPMIEVLHLTIIGRMDAAYINANKWEQLITSHIPHLRIFDIQCEFAASNDMYPLGIKDQINQFTTSFWMTRQWFFSHHFYYNRFGRREMFYSTNPYRYYSI